MSEYGGFAKLMISAFVIVIAVLMNNAKITRIEAPIAVYQVQLLGKIMYFCPDRPKDDVDCGRWLRRTAYGTTVFVQPGPDQVELTSSQ